MNVGPALMSNSIGKRVWEQRDSENIRIWYGMSWLAILVSVSGNTLLVQHLADRLLDYIFYPCSSILFLS